MKTETRRKIKEYSAYLPKVKERIFASAIMLVIAVSLVVGSTFAWITLSSSPEASKISTTVAANGSLEIALEDGDDNTLPTSGRGDSYAAPGNSIVDANVTWGNLVNLSDESYGLQDIELRPARLNTANLANNPLWGAVYGADGRVMTLNSDYAFSTYDQDNAKFLVSDSKGVRAISSYTMVTTNAEEAEAQAGINRMKQPVLTAINAVRDQYANNVMTEDNIEGLRGLLSAYVSGAVADLVNKMADENYTGDAAGETDITPYLGQIYHLYSEFHAAMVLQKDTFVALANFQRYIDSLQENGEAYSEITWDQLAAAPATYDASSAAGTVKLTGLSRFVTDLNGATADLATLRTYYENSQTGTHYQYSNISNIVNRLANPNSVTINGKTVNNLGIAEAATMFNGAKLVLAAGYLKDFEQIAVQSPVRMNVTMDFDIDTSAVPPENELYELAQQVGEKGIKNANVTTAAQNTAYSEKDMAAASNQTLNLVGGTLGAEDTYGLAIDLWFRTNDSGSYLILQGAPESEVASVRVQGTDGDGNSVDLYTATVTQDGTPVSGVDVYQKDGSWYYNKTNTEATVTGTPSEKVEQLTTVNGYSGVNRVWDPDEKPLLTPDSTTQGNGSCYTFYADTPEDQARFLRVLKAMNIAFVDSEGELLAVGVMDTENYYANSGKVIVPVVIRDATTVLRTDDTTGDSYYEELTDTDGNTVYGIMPLQKNVSTFLTAILYLSGDDLGNDDVLSASSIEGQLNLQFGTTPAVRAADNIILERQSRTVTAFTTGTTEFDYNGEAKTVAVSVDVDGDAPTRITAAFQRVVNSVQGKRMAAQELTAPSGDGGRWTGSFNFTAPGVYKLREVMIDGVSYTLAEPLTVTVNGFAVSSVSWGETGNTASVYTADKSYSEPLTIAFGSDSYSPSKVRLVFMNEDGSGTVAANMTKDGDVWRGAAVFGTSGTYTLSYAEVDGEYYDLLDSFKKTLSVSLGLSAKVTTSSATREYYDSSLTYSKNMSVQILDNADVPMEGLTDVQLVYSRGTSTSDTLTAQLTWNSSVKRYEGALPIVNPGTYTFLRVAVGANNVTALNGKAPVFYLRESNPVSYDGSSASIYGSGTVQYVPLSLDAFIGPIRINNSQTAYISAVVHNSETNQDYEITQASGKTAPGTIYYDANAWYINLPTYVDGSHSASQDGVWSVKSITLWDVVDEGGTVRGSDNKLTWTHGEGGVDFSALSTTVSSTLSISMTAGTTALGSSSADFMTSYPFSTLGAFVTVKDHTDFVIPAERMSSIELHLSYVDNKNAAYGYTVTGYTCNPVVRFNRLNDGKWLVSDDFNLQYVGEYNVTGLTVTMVDGKSVTVDPGSNGVPVKYTVTSGAPSADNVALVVTQGTTTLGKTGNEVDGLFLQSYNPSISVKPTVTYKDSQNVTQLARFADFGGIDGASVTLQYKSSQGKIAPNGGSYTWTGTSAYENVTLDMESRADGSYVTSSSSPLLAGAYEIASVAVTVGADTQTLTGEDLGEVDELNVWSVGPTVTMSNPSSSVGLTLDPFETNRNAGTANNSTASYSFHLATNELSGDGYEATLRFATMKASANSWMAAAPRVEATLSGISPNFASAALSVPNDDAVFNFTPSSMSTHSYIGGVGSGNIQSASGDTLAVNYIGNQTMTSISVTDVSGTVYAVPLSHNLVIHENPEPNAALNNVTVSVENGDNGEYVSLTVVETQQNGTVVNHNVAASDTSFTVQEGSNLTITANVSESGFGNASWELNSSSVHTGTNENLYKPRYETYTASTSIGVVKRAITIVKTCEEAGAVTLYNHYFWGASSSNYTGGSLTVTRMDTNEVVFTQSALNTGIAKTVGTANPVALPEGTVLKLEYKNVVIKSGSKFVQIQTYSGTSTSSRQKINVSMINGTATKIAQTATSFTVYLVTGAGELGLNMNLATTSSGAYNAGTSSTSPLQLTY